MKKLLSFLLASMLLSTVAGAVDLYVDNNLIETDTPPTIVDGRTLVPVRAIFEAIGATVEWDNDTRTATGIRNGIIVTIQIDNATAYVNGEARALDVPAQIINSRTMVPARFISEAIGCDVTWYQPTETVGIADKTKGQHIFVTSYGEKYHYNGTCNGGTYYEATLAEAMGRGLTPCDKCVLTIDNSDVSTEVYQPSTPPIIPIPENQNTPSGIGNSDNFHIYDNAAQQQTNQTWVLNTSSMKIHYPSCSQVKKIAPQNYSTSNLSESELLLQGYTLCGACH